MHSGGGGRDRDGDEGRREKKAKIPPKDKTPVDVDELRRLLLSLLAIANLGTHPTMYTENGNLRAESDRVSTVGTWLMNLRNAPRASPFAQVFISAVDAVRAAACFNAAINIVVAELVRLQEPDDDEDA